MPYNPDLHHRRSIRLKGFDYSSDGFYFITICCHANQRLFGEINGGKMILNEAGYIADKCWQAIPDHYPNVILHEYVIMPDHIHGIIELNSARGNPGVKDFQSDVARPGEIQRLSEMPLLIPIKDFPKINGISSKNFYVNKPGFQKIIPKSLSSVVRGFKIGVTKWFRTNSTIHRIWMEDYYEKIIRDAKAYKNITSYIRTNPEK